MPGPDQRGSQDLARSITRLPLIQYQRDLLHSSQSTQNIKKLHCVRHVLDSFHDPRPNAGGPVPPFPARPGASAENRQLVTGRRSGPGAHRTIMTERRLLAPDVTLLPQRLQESIHLQSPTVCLAIGHLSGALRRHRPTIRAPSSPLTSSVRRRPRPRRTAATRPLSPCRPLPPPTRRGNSMPLPSPLCPLPTALHRPWRR